MFVIGATWGALPCMHNQWIRNYSRATAGKGLLLSTKNDLTMFAFLINCLFCKFIIFCRKKLGEISLLQCLAISFAQQISCEIADKCWWCLSATSAFWFPSSHLHKNRPVDPKKVLQALGGWNQYSVPILTWLGGGGGHRSTGAGSAFSRQSSSGSGSCQAGLNTGWEKFVVQTKLQDTVTPCHQCAEITSWKMSTQKS